MVRLNRTYYSLLKFTSKIFKIVSPSQSPAKLRKFRAVRPLRIFYIMFQAPASTENTQEFQRIMQIPHNSPTQSANYAKFTPFANTTPYVSDA